MPTDGSNEVVMELPGDEACLSSLLFSLDLSLKHFRFFWNSVPGSRYLVGDLCLFYAHPSRNKYFDSPETAVDLTI